MTCYRRSREWAFASLGLGMLALDSPAIAADIRPPVKAPHIQSVFDWTGFYIGAHAGFGRGASSAVLSDPAITASSGSFGGVIGGVQAGYNVQLSSGIVLGAEADITFPNYLASNSIAALLATPRSDVVEQLDDVGPRRRQQGGDRIGSKIVRKGDIGFGAQHDSR